MTLHLTCAFEVVKVPNERIIALFLTFSYNFYILLKKLITPQLQEPPCILELLTTFSLYSSRPRIGLSVNNTQKLKQAMVKISEGGCPDMSAEMADHQSQRVNPKTLGFFLSGQHWRGFVFHPLCKIRSRHSRELKLTGLIAYIISSTICKFESWTITNDVITKTMENFGPPRNQTNYISFERY